MIFYMIQFLKSTLGLPIPAVFLYVTTRTVCAAVTGLVLAVFLGPWFIRRLYAMKVGDTVQRDHCPLLEELHAKKENTPTMGGILILASVVLCYLLWMDWQHPYSFLLLLTTVWLGTLGGIDDYYKLKYKNTKGLSAKKKTVWQLLLGLVFCVYLLVPSVSETVHQGRWFPPPVIKEQVKGKAQTLTLQEYAGRIYLPFFKKPILTFSGIGLLLIAGFYLFVLIGSSNAVNLTDGLDGLAAGCVIMAAAAFALVAFLSNHMDVARYLNIAYIEGAGEITVFLSAVIGACLGFLWYNGYPAQLFMGDTGSLALGGILGASAILLNRPFLLALIGGIFVMETLSVIVQVLSFRYRHKKRIFLCTPIHHHFEYKGWPETKIVLRFWIIGFLLATIGVASLKFQ